jgi:pyrrolidone-carboxylate peptidase
LEGLDTWMGQMEDASEEGVLMCQASDDAGRFLCEFIYYTSLRINQNATLFIHVPPLYKPFGAMEIAGSIKTVILKVLEQKNLALPEDQCVSDLQKVVLAMDELPAFD